MATKLKPCPFCGSDRLWTIVIHPLAQIRWWNRFFGKFYIECRICHYCGETKRGKRRAIKAWNRRAEDD